MQVVSLWGDTLQTLGAKKALREVVRLVELALRHSPLLTASPDKHRVEDWLEATQMGLPQYPTDDWDIDREATLTPAMYLWLVKNRSGAVSPILFMGSSAFV